MLKKNDLIRLKTGHTILKGVELDGKTGKVEKVFPEIGLGLATFDGLLFKFELDNAEVVESYTSSYDGTETVTVSAEEFLRAQLTICTEEYLMSHVNNAEATEISWNVVAASGTLVLALLWDYLTERNLK